MVNLLVSKLWRWVVYILLYTDMRGATTVMNKSMKGKGECV